MDTLTIASRAEALRESEAQLAWRIYIQVSSELQEFLNTHLKDDFNLGLADYQLLLILAEAPGFRMRLGELADRMVFSRARLSYQVRQLVARGLIIRQLIASDGRGACAVLTASGLELFREVSRTHMRLVRQHFLRFVEPGDAAVLSRLFKNVAASLDAGAGETDSESKLLS
ncbi:MAG: MarR family transcriptional regulator [Varibaculum sp.]|nr:MarR family transcriptional regulator [Varibaculum sp.]